LIAKTGVMVIFDISLNRLRLTGQVFSVNAGIWFPTG
jgi:hypothetical protein